MENIFDQIQGKIKDPTKKPTALESLKAIFVLFFVITTSSFLFIGIFRVFKALFTDYTLQTIDIAYLSSGACLLGLVVVLSILNEIKKTSDATGKGVLHMMRKINSNATADSNALPGMLGKLFGDRSSTGADFTGSISVVDLSNPNKPIFEGDFNNPDELHILRNKLVNQMMNSNGEFQGKQMTKQDILNSMSLGELEQERVKAEESEDWLWAAAIRDKIAEKRNNL